MGRLSSHSSRWFGRIWIVLLLALAGAAAPGDAGSAAPGAPGSPGAAPITPIPASDSGVFRNDYDYWGFYYPNFSNRNYLTGNMADGYVYRSFFAFTPPGGEVIGAKLRIKKGSFDSEDASETLALHHVSREVIGFQECGAAFGEPCPWDDFLSGVFTDLGDGAVYGSVQLPVSGDWVDIPLNTEGVSALNLSSGPFIVGGAITTLDNDPNTAEFAFAPTLQCNDECTETCNWFGCTWTCEEVCSLVNPPTEAYLDVELNQAPVAIITPPAIGTVGEPMTLDAGNSFDVNTGDQIVKYEWDINNDGVYDHETGGPLQVVTYNSPYSGAVILQVTDKYGAQTLTAVQVNVYNNWPKASFTVVPNPASPPTAITFTSTSFHQHPQHQIVNYAWDFDGNNTIDLSGPSPVVQHTYNRFGAYTAKLTVRDDNVNPPRYDTAQVSVVVDQGNRPPVAHAGGPYSDTPGATITLNGAASADPDSIYGDAIVRYRWDVDNDGVYDYDKTTPTATHTFASTYVGQVGLEVTDKFGVTHTALAGVDIAAPIATLTASPDTGAPTDGITFDASGSSHTSASHSIVSYAWDFDGDGVDDQTGSDAVVQHTYLCFGDHQARVTVSDDGSPPRSASAVFTVHINQGNRPPVAHAGGPYSGTEGVPFNLDASGSTDPDNAYCDQYEYRWDIDGDEEYDLTITDAVFPYFYRWSMPSGVVNLEVRDRFGATSTAQTTVTMLAAPADYTLEVDMLGDDGGADGYFGGCYDLAPDECTLREAISEANSVAPIPVTITVPAGVYMLTPTDYGMTDEDNNLSGDLDITWRWIQSEGEWETVGSHVTIQGSRTGSTIIQGGDGISRVTRVFHVTDRKSSLVLDHVTVRYGGAYQNAGGGIFNQGSLTLTHSAVIDNIAVSMGYACPVCGNNQIEVGEMCDDGNTVSGDGCSATCTMDMPAMCGNSIIEPPEQCDDGNPFDGDGCSAQCMVTACGNGVMEWPEQCDDGNLLDGDGCSAQCTGEFPLAAAEFKAFAEKALAAVPDSPAVGVICEMAGSGGGIYNEGEMVVETSTISGNDADGHGGGIALWNSDSVQILNSTIAFNTANQDQVNGGGGGGIYVYPGLGAPVLRNTVLAENRTEPSLFGASDFGPDCYGDEVKLHSFNLVSDTASCDIVEVVGPNYLGQASGLEPLATSWDPLGLFQSPTPVHRPWPGSPVVDGGGWCEATDQRGALRPQDGDGNGTAVCDIGATELLSPPLPPEAFNAEVVAGGDLVFDWIDTMSGAGSYAVLYSTDPYFQPGDSMVDEAVIPDGASWSHEGAAADAANNYCYMVVGVNEDGVTSAPADKICEFTWALASSPP